MKEEWRPIPGLNGYEASSLGRIRSWLVQVGQGKFEPCAEVPTILRPAPNTNGYLTVSTRGKSMTVHRLVLEAFVGPRPRGHQARHYPDRTRTNCAISNLSWATRSVNNMDKHEHGTHNNLLTEDQVREVLTSKATGVALAKRFGVTPSAICLVRRRKNWKHIKPSAAEETSD